MQKHYDDAANLVERAGFTFHFFSKDYLIRLLFSCVCFALASYLNVLASVIAGYRTPWVDIKDLDGKPTGLGTLPDLGHDTSSWLIDAAGFNSTKVNQWLEVNGFVIPDTMVVILMSFTWAFVLAHPKRFRIIRRVFAITAFVFFLRSLCVISTQLPDAHPKCQAQFTNSDGNYKRGKMFPKAFHRAWLVMLSPASHVTCGDMVFSGHTTFLMQGALIIFHYCRMEELPGGPVFTWPLQFLSGNRFVLNERVCTNVRAFTMLWSAVGALLIIATRLHYTLDVAIAVYLNVRTFRWYHDVATSKKLKARKSIFLLYQGSIMTWLEAEEILSVEADSEQCVKRASSKEGTDKKDS